MQRNDVKEQNRMFQRSSKQGCLSSVPYYSVRTTFLHVPPILTPCDGRVGLCPVRFSHSFFYLFFFFFALKHPYVMDDGTP